MPLNFNQSVVSYSLGQQIQRSDKNVLSELCTMTWSNYPSRSLLGQTFYLSLLLNVHNESADDLSFKWWMVTVIMTVYVTGFMLCYFAHIRCG